MFILFKMNLIIDKEIEDFDNKIKNGIGVSKVVRGTKLLTHFVAKEKAKKILDLGTGTGFIAIFLATKSHKVDASDININALNVAKKNALNNRVKINFIYSNLFKNINSKYDLIIFNPPLGNIGGNRFGELIKSIIPKTNKFTNKVAFFLSKRKRKELIFLFFKKSLLHLTKVGRIIMLIHKEEIDFIQKFTSFKLKLLYMEGDYCYIRLSKNI